MNAKTVHVVMIVTQVISVLSLGVWALIAPFSLVAFRSPEGYKSVASWVFAISVWVYPFIPILCSLSSWKHFKNGLLRPALILTCVPMTIILPFVIHALTLKKP